MQILLTDIDELDVVLCHGGERRLDVLQALVLVQGSSDASQAALLEGLDERYEQQPVAEVSPEVGDDAGARRPKLLVHPVGERLLLDLDPHELVTCGEGGHGTPWYKV